MPNNWKFPYNSTKIQGLDLKLSANFFRYPSINNYLMDDSFLKVPGQDPSLPPSMNFEDRGVLETLLFTLEL